ncbi:MAG: diguanylate cyclase [Labilithrix sp.]|nr:diguanylate cyclase [Labilithrix sp.]
MSGKAPPSQPPGPSRDQVEGLLQPHRKRLAKLRRASDLSKGDFDAAVRQVTELASAVLDVERASVWRLAPKGAAIECLDLYVRGTNTHAVGGALARETFPAYFAALETERCIAADDAHTDPRTSEFSSVYLRPNGIGAMLDSPIFVQGKMVGVVCHEHVGDARAWNLWEELVAATLADFVAHVMESEHRVSELNASEESFRELFEASPSPLMLVRRTDGTIVLSNSRAREIMALPDDDAELLEGGRFYENADDRAKILADLAARGFVEGREVRMKNFRGEPRWCLMSARTLTYRGEPHIAVGVSDVTALKDVEARLREAAMRDPLTNLYDRRFFQETGTRELERARRYGRPLSLAMIDVDHFKSKNDAHGHGVGDELLVALAKIASRELRQSDLLARYGGEELVILFPETDLEEAARVTERLRATVAREPFATSAGPLALTVSGGVVGAVLRDGSLGALDELVDRAERALDKAKGEGKNRVVVD